MLDAYYALRGWDAQGVPTPERLRALGLADLAGETLRRFRPTACSRRTRVGAPHRRGL